MLNYCYPGLEYCNKTYPLAHFHFIRDVKFAVAKKYEFLKMVHNLTLVELKSYTDN